MLMLMVTFILVLMLLLIVAFDVGNVFICVCLPSTLLFFTNLTDGNYKQIITVYIQYRTIYARASLSTLLRASAKSGPDIVSMAIDPCACNDVCLWKRTNLAFLKEGAR